MRVFAERMQTLLGQPIVVDPRAGGGTVVGTLNAIQQPPDGYTVLLTTASQEIRSAQPNPPFDIRKDVSVISQIKLRAADFRRQRRAAAQRQVDKDLIAFARQSWQAQRRHLRRRLGGAPGAGHFTIVTGVNLVHVP